MEFTKWYLEEGLSSINKRLLDLRNLKMEFVLLNNLLTEEELMVLGDDGISKLSLALAYDGADIVKVTYSDGSEEFRYQF